MQDHCQRSPLVPIFNRKCREQLGGRGVRRIGGRAGARWVVTPVGSVGCRSLGLVETTNGPSPPCWGRAVVLGGLCPGGWAGGEGPSCLAPSGRRHASTPAGARCRQQPGPATSAGAAPPGRVA